MINRLLLVVCVCIVVALILYFFYWNRFIAFVIGKSIRILFWNQEGPSIWIEISSIHFSLLAGRILLKDIRYHSSNQTIKIVKGQIQWRYWIRRPTSEEEINPARGENVKLSARLWSCRIQLTFEGMEWFLYNRTAAYDGILEQVEKASRPTSRASSHHRRFRRFSRQGDTSPFYPPSLVRTSLRVPEFVKKAAFWVKSQLPTLDPKELLPLGISVRTGAIILGNPSTPNLLVAEFQNASGTFGIVPSRSKYDLYKQVLNLKFQKSSIRLVHNEDYVDPMTTLGAVVHGRIKHNPTLRKPIFYQPYRAFTKIWRQLKLYSLINDYLATRRAQRRTQPLKFSAPSSKFNKGPNEDTPVGIDFSTFEYAIERKILEAPILELTYYVDVVGDVPSYGSAAQHIAEGVHDIRNGGTSPEWGFDVIIYGGTIRYGPWADRQRTELQRAFFPPTYLDSTVTATLKPGEKRMWEALQIFVELRDETTLHLPFREASKDWQWDGVTDIPQMPRTREAASLVVDVGDRSSISYVMPMIVGPSGYESTLEVHLDAVSITSSLNDIRLISAESCRVRCELPSPIRWDAERTWSFAVFLRQPVLFILRDHVNMFTDLAKDWVSGPPTEYQKFIPMIYSLKLEMHHFELNLYANDQNIVDKPLIKDENALMTFKGPHLRTSTTIPSNQFRPESTSIPFSVDAPDLLVYFSLPRWNTHALHAGKEGIRLLKTSRINVTGSHRYFSEVADEYTEQLKIHFDLEKNVYWAYGWSIRYLMVLRDNYLGSFTHFQTLSEYLDKRKQGRPVGDPIGLKYRPGKSNMLQVEMSLRAEGSNIMLPLDLIGDTAQKLTGPMAKVQSFEDSRCISLSIPEIQLQFRMHDYYMEMSLNIDTITGSIPHSQGHLSHRSVRKKSFMIDGLDITANRLFGPQPRTATYVCIWEIAVGNVKASMSANDAQILVAAGNTFRLNFVDLVNSPADDFVPDVDPDVTFYKVTVKKIEAVWRAGHAALFLQMSQGLNFDSNDLGAHQYRKVTTLKIPEIRACVLLTTSMEKNTWLEVLEVFFDLYMDMYSSPVGHRLLTRKQMAFIEEQDKPTGRAKLMFSQLRQRTKANNFSDHISHRNGVFLPQPSLPNNITYGSTTHVPPGPPSPSGRPPSWRASSFANLSDSDEEEISEADRDARLARTRTSTPAPEPVADDVTMSTGDESDDADLTDGDSTGDNWSEAEVTGNEKPVGTLMAFYSPILRHYEANCLEYIGSMEGAPFTVTRDKASFVKNSSGNNDSTSLADAASEHFSLPDGLPKDENVTTHRIKLRKGVEIFYSPLLLSAIAHFEKDVESVNSSHEVLVDSLLVGCLENAKPSKPKCQVVDLDLPALVIQLIQHVRISEESALDAPKVAESVTIPHSLDVTAILKFTLSAVHLVGIYGRQSKPLAVKASLNQCTAVLNVSIDKKTIGSSPSDPIIVDINLSTSSMDASQRNLRANFGPLDIRVGNRGPEVLTTTVAALISTAEHLSKQLKGIKSYQVTTSRNRISTLLQTSEKWPVIDTLSTIQPSYLVQSGIPHVLRTDTTFRFLYHLRNCIWSLYDADDLHIPQVSNPINLSEFLTLVESRLSLLDQDTSDVAQLLSMKSLLFEEQATKYGQEKGFVFDTLSVDAKAATITVLAPTGRMSTQFIANNLGLNIYSRSLDLIQFNFSNVSSASQTSLRSKSSKVVQKMVILLSIDDISLVISPHLMHFAQHILRVKRQMKSTPSSSWTSKTNRGSLERYSSSLRSIEVIGSIHRLRIQAAAENLTLVMGLRKLQTSSTLLAANKRIIQSAHIGVLFDEIYFQARTTSDPAKESNQDILASLTFNTGRISAISRPETEATRNIMLIFTLAGMRLHVPRSALRLYHFVGEWRADYLPGMEAAIKTLLSEYHAGPAKPHSPAASRMSGGSPIFRIHCQITHFEISLQVMHGTWLSWEINKTVGYIQSSAPKKLGGPYAFGLQTASMVISVSSKPNARDVAPSSRVKLMLPSISVAGHSDGYNVHTLILFEFIELKVKPSHWDTLLSVQQKFGQDFNDLVALMQKAPQERSVPTPNKPKLQSKGFQYEAHLKMQGFRIGLEGAGSTVLLECQDIDGGISNSKGWAWDVELSNLALSLAPRARGRRDMTFNRDQRSAFVIIDFKFSGSGSDVDAEKTLELSISKMHAVLQPSSIGELGDFIDNLQAEMLERQEQRALELATFKEKTRSVLNTFDVNLGDVQSEKTSWINHSIVNISIQSLGLAFPLIHDDELVIPHAKGKESTPVRAFLFSIKSIQFGTHRGESGQANMQHLCFQFVSRFRQSIPEDFAAEKHHTRNRLLYPKMTAQLRSTRSGTTTKFWVKADVNGFIFDIDSTIPKYIFSLIDVYRQGKERVDRLSTTVPLTPFSATPMTDVSKPPPLEKHYTAIPTSNIFASLTFHSGKVRLYSGSASNLFKAKILSSTRPLELSDDQILELGAEVFKLPIVSVWIEYKATPASQKLSKGPEIEPSVLIFNSTVHSSNNTLRPILLPFLTELVSHVESRIRRVSFRTRPSSSVLLTPHSNGSPPRIEQEEEDSFSSLQICFSLRIDKSKLELTCQPDVNVVAGLHWESGGFIVNMSPGARKISFFGSVGGLTIGLKHGFLSEDCVKLDARNLSFSVSFQKLESGLGHSISLVLDTEFLGGVRFSRLQDILCFKAVWLDHIPIFNNQSPTALENGTPTSLRPTYEDQVTSDPSNQGKVSTMLLVRIRKIKLEIDLGQSISKINLELDDSVLRTNLTDDLKEVFVFIGDVSLSASGNLAGSARVPSCVFQTIRRSETSLWDDHGRGKMLELRLTSGALVVSLQSDHQELLLYRAQPLEVEIFDDWSRSLPRAEDKFRPLQLSFTVACPEIVVSATVGTIPKLLSYANKFKANLDAQRQGAFRESQTFRATRTPKPDNPLSAVAEAMLHSARSRFKEADSGLSYIIRQHISLRLDLLRLIVFPRTTRDTEVAQFIGRNVEAQLNGLVGTDLTPGKRDLRLSFSSMIISRYTQVFHPPSTPPNALKPQEEFEWPIGLFKDATEAIIVGLPSMKMHMISEEITDESGKTLTYDFDSQFVRQAGMKAFEDIYITLNMSLYSWLTVLRKNLTRELDQVRATEEWRTSMSNVSTSIVAGGSQRKKKVPDPLSLTDSPRSATLPSGGAGGSSSAFAPSSARHGWPDQYRSPQSSREQSLLSPSLSQPLSSPLQFPVAKETPDYASTSQPVAKRSTITYRPRIRHIERLTMRQLGEATPDVMHPFFMKKAGFNLEDSLPQYVNEYAVVPLEEIMEVLLKLYSQQLLTGAKKVRMPDQS